MTDNTSSRSLEMHDAHFPGRAPIEAYGNGGFHFADMSHQGSILCLPSGVFRWDVISASDLVCEAFQRVFEKSGIEVFLLGLGSDFLPVPSDIRTCFKEHNITVDGMSTGAAVRTYNVLLSESRAVGCGLIAVDI